MKYVPGSGLKGCDDKKGDKRCRTHCLGHLVSFLNLILYFIDTNQYFIVSIACNIQNTHQEGCDNENRPK